ncbi:RPM1-INTERACTING PROTEIN 4 (RIN4) FAMILY PROTEIN [Salix koriyanagi]|uniref:RPM1-INTERACTING PROTEIN 4 (RIN4) FAMILY PROTEIN n=1 Tax=Salix koriyanagi TaxID=2511006 RepID=A0A9Q0W6M9_9ROSI|nr:RPM1-INTERACTING PROTEIN 4 (RIN4) FAMILY PROTEIN [Salix koriyanagi]KAJ6761392.1 RPM1-INTERACTING PROTEIN 4 (RIN4) FAMILY PROTEIN [Salix koriyanagi]
MMIFLFQQGRPLPKFGEWDVSNPASAEGFTVIFNKARDEKKTKNSPAKVVSPRRTEPAHNKNAKNENYKHPPKRRWLCCVELITH